MPNQDQPPRFVSIAEFCRRSSLSRSTCYNLISQGVLPRPTRLTPKRVAFPDHVVSKWFENMSAGTGAAQ